MALSKSKLIRSLSSKWEIFAPDNCRACGDEEELESIKEILFHYPSMLRRIQRISREPALSCMQALSFLNPESLLDVSNGITLTTLYP